MILMPDRTGQQIHKTKCKTTLLLWPTEKMCKLCVSPAIGCMFGFEFACVSVSLSSPFVVVGLGWRVLLLQGQCQVHCTSTLMQNHKTTRGAPPPNETTARRDDRRDRCSSPRGVWLFLFSVCSKIGFILLLLMCKGVWDKVA